jgi:hypothetical protein
MDGDTKARHVRDHRREGNDTQAWLDYRRKYPETLQRRLTQTPPELQGNTAVPKPNDHPAPRRPSVRFSPKTVEKRTAYNDSANIGLGIFIPGFAGSPTRARTTGSDADLSTWGSHSHRSSQSFQGADKAVAKVPAKPSIKKKSKLTISTDDNGRRTLEYDLSNNEYMYRDAHDPRRRSSSASLGERDRNLRPYTYVDDGGGWDGSSYSDDYGEGESDDDDDDDSHGRPARPQKMVRGGKMRGGEVPVRQVVEVGSEDEDGDGSEEDGQEEEDEDDQDNDQDGGHEDDGRPGDDEGQGQEEQDDSGIGDEEQDGNELGGHGSGGSEGSEDDEDVNFTSNSDIEDQGTSRRRSSRVSQQGSSAAGEGGNNVHDAIRSVS